MKTKKKAALPLQAGTLGKTAPKTQVQNTTPLRRSQQRIISALEVYPAGVLSHNLRDMAHCMNIADQIMILRRMGFRITCEMEPFTTIDGVKSRIGRYCLEVAE